MTRRVVILEPDLDGHHAFWLALLVEAHRRAGWGVEVLTAEDTSRLQAQAALHGFAFEEVRLHVARGTKEAGLLDQALALADKITAERVFIAFIDRYWPAIIARSRNWPAVSRLTGIWFHPHALDTKWRYAPPWGKRWKTRGRLHRFLASPGAERVLASLYFTVDEPLAQLAGINPRVGRHLLPDPFEREPRLGRDEARGALGLPRERTVFLHLGSPERRKGLPDVLAAFRMLASQSTPTGAAAPLLLRVGPNDRLSRPERIQLDELISKGWAIAVEKFVPATELMEYFSACDWVLIPYRKFRYSSGILANAIGAGRRVIAADYGHIGREVARAGLGLTYRHGSPAALARALAEAVQTGEGPADDGQKALRTTDYFIETLAGSLR